MFFIGYCSGCIAGPQLWTHSPRYSSGVITAIVDWVLLFLAVVAYRFLCARDNASRGSISVESDLASHGKVVLDDAGQPESDLTDKEDKLFRYSL